MLSLCVWDYCMLSLCVWNYCMLSLCVWSYCMWDYVYVKFVCVKLLYVKFVCVKLLYVRLLYVKFVCVKLLLYVWGRRREEEEKPGIQNQKQEPHTKMWGKKIYIHSKPHHQTPWLLWFSHVKIYEMWDEHSWPNSSMERWLQGFVPSLVMPIWGWKLSEHVNRPTAPNMNIWLWLIFLEQTWRIPISERTRIHN